MPETVSIICLSPEVRDVVDRAIRVLNGSQDRFRFQLVPGTRRLPPPDLADEYSWDLLTSVLAEVKQSLGAEYLLGMLDQAIENNWFSRTVHDQKICFITTKDWEYLSELPLVAYVGLELAENLVEMLLGDVRFHEETRGCLHDLCEVKPHISFKLRTADICAECMDLLSQRLEPDVLGSVVAMLEEVRRVALGRGARDSAIRRLSLPDVVDRDFPFPVAYCFRSMQSELSYSRKWLKLLELYEVMVKYASFVLLAALRASRGDAPAGIAEHLTGLKRPSSGHWHAACFALVQVAGEQASECFLARYLATLDRRAIRRAQQASADLVALRNDTRGHGLVEEEARYQVLYDGKLSAVQALLEFVAPLARYPLVKPTGPFQRRRGISRFSVKLMVGSHPLFPVQQHQTREEVDTDCLLHDPETGRYLSLYPWVMLDNCRECYREMVFLYDKVEHGTVVMREYPTNHRQQRDAADEVLHQIGAQT